MPEYHLFDLDTDDASYCEDVQKKRAQKMKYAKMPLFWRRLLISVTVT